VEPCDNIDKDVTMNMKTRRSVFKHKPTSQDMVDPWRATVPEGIQGLWYVSPAFQEDEHES
jgi:hypothetical protein